MIDAHTHLENGDLSIEYVHKFIDAAKEKGITHLQVLDHTHIDSLNLKTVIKEFVKYLHYKKSGF